MSKLYTAKDLESMIERGQCLSALPSDAKLTPMARDLLRQKQMVRESSGKEQPLTAASPSPRIHEPVLPDAEYNWVPGSDPKTAAELERFFYSPAIQTLKERICQIGKRIWSKGYVDGNGGNITVRVGDNLVLCTPTLISKGFMQPEDICMVDLDGNQVAGTRPRTSEVNTHLGIMKNEPKAKSCVHAHPVYATAFAVAGVTPPSCLIPEPEVFLGEIGFASYQTPGTPENAKEVGQLAKKHQSILMQNHGVICWGKDVEDAYWKMENTDAFCHTVTITLQLGGPQKYGPDKLRELIEIRKKLGMPDHRLDELKECELCDSGDVTLNTAPQPCGSRTLGLPASGEVDEALVKQITDLIMAKLS
ncbi:MAG: class II aldolase/adducin family protein [Puniceicoccaceae bacterium]